MAKLCGAESDEPALETTMSRLSAPATIDVHVALNTWTNLINEVAKTDIDFPVLEKAA